MMKPLRNARHEKFAQGVAQGIPYADAYSRAGYAKATPSGARKSGSRLMTNVDIAERVQFLIQQAAFAVEVKAEDVIRELARVGFSNLQDVWKVAMGGDLAELTRAHAAAIAEITVDRIEGGKDEPAIDRVKLKLHPKIPALVKLGEHLGIFADANRQDVNVHFAISDAPMTDSQWEAEYGGESDMGSPGGAADGADPVPGQ